MQRLDLTSFGIGVLLGIFFSAAWFFSDRIPPLTTPETTLATTTPALTSSEGGAVAVSDQAAGTSVLVDSVTVPPPGVWVAVLETDSDGQLGNVLGATRVHGPLSNVSVALLRPTEPGRVYAVELYRPDQNGSFDPNADSVYVDFDTGERVLALFNTK